nr:zinc finger BED domain-containing protein 4-like [Aedes albopictus]
MSDNKRSAIWEFFVEIEEGRRAKCVECNATLSRGGIGKVATNSSMINHLKKHSEAYRLYREKASEQKSSKSATDSSQPTIEDSFAGSLTWEHNSPKAKDVTKSVAEMIVLDHQPVSMVQDRGFVRLMAKLQPRYKLPCRKHFTTVVLPEMFEKCKKAIRNALPSDGGYMSFTTDIWSSPNNKAVISLTAHWFDEKGSIMQYAVLNASEFPGSHTGERIGIKMHEMLQNWDIGTAQVHLILRDNAANMQKGLNDAELPNVGCFIHTLQLAILDALECQKILKDALAKSRNIVTHFNHSPLACNKLSEIQENYGLPKRTLVQDVRTRWNSTFYMLERMQDQRAAITYFAGEVSTVKNLTEYEWNMTSRLLELLRPFEEITRIVSSEDSCISEVIPYVATLRLFLEKSNSEHKGVEPTKETLLKGLNTRFKHIFDENVYTFATVLDPRFKLNFIPENNRKSLIERIVADILDHNEDQPASKASAPEAQKQADSSSGFWKCFEEIGSNQPQSNDPAICIIKNEFEQYQSEKIIERKLSPYAWWSANKYKFPNVYKLAKRYLSAPASTVVSERLFSTEGLVYEQHRNRLLPENGEMLTCMKRNFKYLESI